MMKGKSRKNSLSEEMKRRRKREKIVDVEASVRTSNDVHDGMQVGNRKKNSSVNRKGKEKDKDIMGRDNSKDEIDSEEQSDGVVENCLSDLREIKDFKHHREITSGVTIKPCGTKEAKKKTKEEELLYDVQEFPERGKEEELLYDVQEFPERGPAADQNKICIIFSGDEDCSKGMKKWIMEYHQSRPGSKLLKQQIDDFITDHDAKLEQERKDREAQAAEEGWTVVVRHKGRKKTTDSESRVAVDSVAHAAVEDKMVKKKHKEVPLGFYCFQKREAQRNEIMILQSKFEDDKKSLQQLRASGKFRPYWKMFPVYMTWS